MAMRSEGLRESLRVSDPASRALARLVRDSLLAAEREPLPSFVRGRLGTSSGAERLRLAGAVVRGFGEAVSELVRDEMLEPEIEERLLRVVTDSGIREADFEVDGALSRVARVAARRELLRGRLPTWHAGKLGLVETTPHAVWTFPDAAVHAAGAAEVPASWADWTHSDLALEGGSSRSMDLDGFEDLGRGRLVVGAGGIRLDSPQRWFHLALRTVSALELRSDGVILHADGGRLAIVEGDGWFLAELLRLVHEATVDAPVESTSDL